MLRSVRKRMNLALMIVIMPVGLLTAPPESRGQTRGTRRAIPAAARGEPRGAWIGQDGEDYAGPSTKPGGNEIQDIHVRLDGLPDQALKRLVIQGLGGDAWASDGEGGFFIKVVREGNSPRADLYFEPVRAETGRGFEFKLGFENGSQVGFWVEGGKADPNRRVKGAEVRVEWAGQGQVDRVGGGPAVGPDGLRDARLILRGLSERRKIRSVRIDGPAGQGWQSGTNPEGLANAELVPRKDDPATAEVVFQPTKPLNGVKLNVTVTFEDATSDKVVVRADRVDPKLAMAAPAPVAFLPNSTRAEWLGQDGVGAGPGDLHVVLDDVPGGRAVVAVALSDESGNGWSWRDGERGRYRPDPEARPLQLRKGPEKNTLHAFFRPIVDEQGATLTARLVFDDGRSTLVAIAGGTCDPTAASARPASTTVEAKPGDDLAKLVEAAGTIRLAPGLYELDQPLILPNSVAIVGQPGSILRFRQAEGASPWTAAIKIQRGNTRLEGFQVRFAGPIRWKENIQYGPAVIGSPDNFDPGNEDSKAGIVLTGLDLESPPPAKSDGHEEAIGLARLVTASSGRIESCRLRGGMITVRGGPWAFVSNAYMGTHPGSFSHAVLSAARTRDLLVKGNTTTAEGPSGKTWRFLVQTQGGLRDVVEGNRIETIGPRDGDPRDDNAPEIILTEAYRLHFVGRLAALSKDGRVVQIPEPQGEPARTGAIVAVLEGPKAGSWSRVVQGIDPTTYLVDPPLSAEAKVLAITTGFVEETYRDNTIDTKGGTVACNLVLVGNHFGTKVIGNTLIGGGGFKIAASPSEQPVHWGWSHVPSFDVEIVGNTLQDQQQPAFLGVERSPAIKSSRDRVYFTAKVRDNRIAWTDPSPKGIHGIDRRVAVRINAVAPLDPNEAVVDASGFTSTGGSSRVAILGAKYNGKVVKDQAVEIPESRAVAGEGPRPLR